MDNMNAEGQGTCGWKQIDTRDDTCMAISRGVLVAEQLETLNGCGNHVGLEGQ